MVGDFRLEYAVTRPYPWRRFTLVTGVLFMALLSATTIINVALVGYDMQATIRTDFNRTREEWWHGLSALRQQQASCQPLTLKVGDTFRTTIGAFSYVVNSIADDKGAFQLPSQPFIQYSNSSLSECDVTNITLSSQGMIFRSAWTATMVCPPPFPVRATMSWVHGSPNEDSYQEFELGSFNGTSPDDAATLNSPSVTIQDVLAAVNDDFIGENHGDASTQFLFNFQAHPRCSGTSCSASDNASPIPIDRDAAYTPNAVNIQGQFYDIGGTGWDFASNVSARNVMQAILSGVRLDVGHVTPNNIFTSRNALQATILPNGTDTRSTAPLLNTGIGYHNLGRIPVIAPGDVFIETAYLCNDPHIKNAASLLASVFASTGTMVMAAWSIWILAASYLARKRERGRTNSPFQRRGFRSDSNAEEVNALVNDRFISMTPFKRRSSEYAVPDTRGQDEGIAKVV